MVMIVSINVLTSSTLSLDDKFFCHGRGVVRVHKFGFWDVNTTYFSFMLYYRCTYISSNAIWIVLHAQNIAFFFGCYAMRWILVALC